MKTFFKIAISTLSLYLLFLNFHFLLFIYNDYDDLQPLQKANVDFWWTVSIIFSGGWVVLLMYLFPGSEKEKDSN